MPDEDGNIPLDDNERPINEEDRPISEDAYLDTDGICYFGGPEAKLPSDVHIVAGIGVLDFIKDLIIKNPDGAGIKTVFWKPSDPIPEKVIGAAVDLEILDIIQKANAGRGVLLKDPNGLRWMTLDEWNTLFGTDGLAQAIKMRLYWQQGGGVGTPGQRVTGYHQVGHARKSGKEYKKLGKW
jgi:hypothetical protein